MKKGFDSVSICEMSRDSNESVFTYGHWLAAMVADRQRKVKLLAIEEELARLELELLMETRAGYLGAGKEPPKDKEAKEDDINCFKTFVLDEVIKRLESEHGASYQINELPHGTLLETMAQYEAFVSKQYHSMDIVPELGWTVRYGDAFICILLEFKGNTLYMCVIELGKLRKTTNDKLIWTLLWNEKIDYAIPQKILAEKFEAAYKTYVPGASAVIAPPITTPVRRPAPAPAPAARARPAPRPTAGGNRAAPVPEVRPAAPRPTAGGNRAAPVAEVRPAASGPTAPPGGPTPAAGTVTPVADAQTPGSSSLKQ